MKSQLPLKLNLGDSSESRVYYIPHYIAQTRGYFAKEGIEVLFTSTTSGGATVQGGQIPAIVSGAADLTIGGPMVIMRMRQDNEAHLVAFCAAVNVNPWFLAGRSTRIGLDLADLAGKRVIDISNIATANLCFRWLLKAAGVKDVTILPGSRDEAADLASVLAGQVDYALHSLHGLAPHLVANSGLGLAADLAGPTGLVPWSAYIADPRVLAERREDFQAFTRAIERALADIANTPPQEIAHWVQPYYNDYPHSALTLALEHYRAVGAWPRGSLIAPESFHRFSGILQEIGWLAEPADYAANIDTSFAKAHQ
ncbi:ABC transporter substrate-binding protein [Microvirga calopogonii]|uniref:ABC transporter substrate-binding protein n=1 Tax=Microvirga calopogonii TaxID=2078013 RepID=UPI0013B45211|nr:ABC transporter substrate-binding protein [Microvirga calopogonii]